MTPAERAKPRRLPLWQLLLFAPVALAIGVAQALLRRNDLKRPSSAALDAAQRVIDRGGRQ